MTDIEIRNNIVALLLSRSDDFETVEDLLVTAEILEDYVVNGSVD